MPLRIVTRRITGLFFGQSVTVVQEQTYERVQDPTVTPRPPILTTGAGDDTMLSAIDYNPNTPPANFAFLMRMLGMAVQNGRTMAANGDPWFRALAQPYAQFGQPSIGGGYPEIDRILNSFYQFLLDRWGEDQWNQVVEAWVRSQQAESPRTMLTIQEYIDGVDKWGEAAADVMLTSFPDRSTPMWQISDSGPTITLPPLERISHEVQRVNSNGALSLTQEAQRWQAVATAFPGTPEGDRAQEIATYLAAQPLGASTATYAAWAHANLRLSFDAMTPIEPLSAVASQPATAAPASRFAEELDRIANSTPGTRPAENTLWRQIANDIGPDTAAGLVALDIAGWISATYDETNPTRVSEYKTWATRMLTRSLTGVTPPP